MSDDTLLSRFVSRKDEDAFHTLVERHSGMVYAACFRDLGDVDKTEEAAQAVFIVLAEKAQSIRKGNALPRWLFKVAKTVVFNMKREEKRRKKREAEAAAMKKEVYSQPQDDAEWEKVRPHLNAAVASLSRKQQDAVIGHFLEGRTHKEVAETLVCSEDAVRMRISYALRKLRRKLAKEGVVLSGGVLAGFLAAETVTAAPPGLAASCHAASMAALAGNAAAFSTPVLLSQGVIKMMIWAKIKTAAICIAGLAVLTGAGTPAVMNILADGREQMEISSGEAGNETAEIDKPSVKPEKKGQLVNGVLFEPVLRNNVWLVPMDGSLEPVSPGLRVINKTDSTIYLNRFGLGFRLIGSDGKTMRPYPAYYAKSRAPYRPKKEDFLVLESNQTKLLACKGNPVYPGWGSLRVRKSIMNERGQEAYYGSGDFRFFPISEPGRYRLVITNTGRGTLPDIHAWEGTYESDPLPVRIVYGLQTSISRKNREAVTTLGRLCCLTVRSKARMEQLAAEFDKLEWGKPDTLFSNVDFTNEMIIFFLRAGLNAEKDRIVNFLSGPEQAVIRFSTQQFPRLATKKLYHITAVLLPQAKVLKAEIPEQVKTTGKQADGSKITIYREMHRTWIIGPHGGDVADGLQGFIEAEKKVIRPGEDIKVKFILKAADPAQKEPIHVWDGKFSSGYRNDAYLVRTPGGKTHFLRRKELLKWRKNIPHPVAVTSGNPYVLPGNIRYDSPLKSMKNIAAEMQLSGFNTSAAGVYTITGIYMETGEPAKHGFGYDRNNPPSMWGGNIATNTVRVRVEE